MNEAKCKIILVLGGAKSGKTGFALKKASFNSGTKAYIATAQALDKEMVERIERHRAERGLSWDTYEEPLKIADLLRKLEGRYCAVVLDCLTLWISNLIHNDAEIDSESGGLLSALKEMRGAAEIFVVSNEVGMGIVPANELARAFRDHAGTINQHVAEAADEVYLVTAGIPLKIK
jgi:adenosylcobinamide kinase / adenosylcobinamide-phosphate guanylyltransferase